MKLLFDANLSSKLVERLSDVFPGSAHVSALGLERALDRELLARAAEAGFIVVSKDEDLHQLVLLHGPPPKVVWVRLGNCTTPEAEAALRGVSSGSPRSRPTRMRRSSSWARRLIERFSPVSPAFGDARLTRTVL